MKSYGTVMLLTAMEFRNLPLIARVHYRNWVWPCSHNEGDLHWKNQCTIGDCLSEATGAAERSLEPKNLPETKKLFQKSSPKAAQTQQ